MNDISVIEREFKELDAWRTAPEFWPALPAQAEGLIQRLRQAKRQLIGHSAGGREIFALEYGEKEPIDAGTDNLHSALSASLTPPDPTAIYPGSFYGMRRRRKPAVVFQGAIHGSELTGTVASLNLCWIIETGKDLRGKEWPRLRELARNSRIAIIPWLNMDGAMRSPWGQFSGMPSAAASCINLGVTREGAKLAYPAHKELFPIAPSGMAFMGTYFNDAGVNLQYDFCSLAREPETCAWMDYYLDERPDGVVVWHCNAGSLIGPPGYYLPQGYQLQEARIGGVVRARLQREGYVAGRMSWANLPGLGKPVIDQTTAVYHVCGAAPIMCELPAGCREYFFTLDDMLDIGLIVIEEILAYAHSDGLRPYELWEKVRKQTTKQEPSQK